MKNEESPRLFMDKNNNIQIWESQKVKKERSREPVEEIMAKTFSNLRKETDIQIQET